MAKRKSLGRGLEALLSTNIGSTDAVSRDRLKEVPIDLLEKGRYQPRDDIREDTLAEMAETIRVQGLIQPIVVRPLSVDQTSGTEVRYEIVAGERRWRAAQLAGLHSIPALVRNISDHAAAVVAILENIQREDLNPLEEAKGLRRLVDEFEMTHGEAADAVGRSRVSVSNLLRLLELPDLVKDLLAQRALSMGHARALLALESLQEQLTLAQQVVKEGWSVRKTERAVKRLAKAPVKIDQANAAKNPDVRRLEIQLGEKLGANVRIEERSSSGGRLIIRYHSLEELEGIVDHMT
jgi:ParB family chromosome partitioning protein